MNFWGLTTSYWKKQTERVDKVRAQINARISNSQGRTVPSIDDLSIGTGRHIAAAVMFIDICSFSDRSSESKEDQESILATLNLFFSEMIKIANDYGGTVEKNTGDGLMAYFEDGVSSEPNGAHKALACALSMMAANQHLITPVLNNSNIEPIKFRIAIEHGNVTIAKVGAAQVFNSIVAIGTTANIASKMLSHCGNNEIILGDRAKSKLPKNWITSWATIHKVESGWVYRKTNTHYPLYLYQGRWSRLV